MTPTADRPRSRRPDKSTTVTIVAAVTGWRTRYHGA